MTSNVELLPLPEKVEVDKHLPTGVRIYAYDKNTLKDYALANVLHHTAPLRYALDNAARDVKTLRGVMDSYAAEIEALRAEVERLNRILGRIVEGDGDSTTAIRAGTDAFAAAREYLLRDREEGHEGS